MDPAKGLVRDFWEEASCGENLYLKGSSKDDFLRQSSFRYDLEPYILEFAQFGEYTGKMVLEVGIGFGADHQRFAEAGAQLFGIDLTKRALDYVSQRFHIMGLEPRVMVGDAEHLAFADETFDLVYSWGVIISHLV